MTLQERSNTIKAMAQRQGFSFVGIAKAEYMDEEARRLDEWLGQTMHGKMDYMANHFDLRVDPTKLVPGARSVVSLMYNYHTDKKQQDPSAPQLSMYAFGRDYHKVVRKKLKLLLHEIADEFGEIAGRGFVDSAPVLERDWAKRAGNGWIGKNSLLIHPKAGSKFFLAELIIDLELEPDAPIRDYCGTCTRCIEACPTDAISEEGYVVDGSKCISYLTIELKDAIPSEFESKMGNWVFGCDICQDVCPWNRFSTRHTEAQFEPSEALMNLRSEEWYEMSEVLFDELFTGSAVKRTGYTGLRRNLNILRFR